MAAYRCRRSVAAAVVGFLLLLTGPITASTAHAQVADFPAHSAGPVEPVPIPGDLAASAADGPVDVIVGVQMSHAATQLAADKAAAVAAAGTEVRTLRSYDRLPVELVRVGSVDALRDLAGAPGVTSLAAPGRYWVTADKDLTVIRQPEAQAAGYTGVGTAVAVIDTGVDPARIGVNGAFGNCNGGVGTGSCRIRSYTDVAGSGQADSDPDGHGTNVAGIVAKTAPGAGLHVYGVFNSDFATDSDILWALNDIAASGPARGIRAVNMSFGNGSFHTTTCQDATGGFSYSSVFGTLRSAGILPVVAAGNAGYDPKNPLRQGVSSPACAAGAVSVGATYTESSGVGMEWGNLCTDARPTVDRVTCFSQSGPTLSLLAPGVDITAAGIKESGTSQAAPHVAAAVADVASADPTLSAGEIADLLTGTGPMVTDPRSGKVLRRLDVAAATGAAAAARPISVAGGFVALPPERVYDSRIVGGSMPARSNRTLAVAGAGGVPRSAVAAVVVTVTAVTPAGGGYLTAWAAGAQRPAVSGLSFSAGQNTAATMVVEVGTAGGIQLFNGASEGVHVLVDVSGYFLGGVPEHSGTFAGVPPSRILDTRLGSGPLAGLASRTVQVSGAGGIPPSASAVAVALTAVAPGASGYLTTWPGGPRPQVSTVNFGPGQNRSNLAVLAMSGGQISVFNGSAAPVQLLVDVAGYYLGGTPTQPGTFVALSTPSRLLDTRPTGAVPRLGTTSVTVSGRGGVPATGVSAVLSTVTAVAPTAVGYLTVWPFGSSRPVVSNVNFTVSRTIANVAAARLGSAGRLALFNGSSGTVQLLVDVAGYYRGP